MRRREKNTTLKGPEAKEQVWWEWDPREREDSIRGEDQSGVSTLQISDFR